MHHEHVLACRPWAVRILIVLVVVLRHETWCSIVDILELGGVRAVERRVARERHQELLGLEVVWVKHQAAC